MAYVGVGVIVVLVIAAIAFLLRWQMRRREMQRKVDDKLREEALDRALVGPHTPSNKPGTSSSVPYDVRYDLDQRKKTGQQGVVAGTQIMIQLIEKSELSTRKYIFHIADRITFGGQTKKCDIAVPGIGTADCLCELFRIGKELYVKSEISFNHVQLRRGKKQVCVEQNAIKLKDRDVLIIGGCTYEIQTVKN